MTLAMPNGRARTLPLLVGTALALGGVLWLQPYSVFSPYRPYAAPAKRFLRAALAGDSAGLERQAVSSAAVRWALGAARRDPAALAVWAGVLRPRAGQRRGDTVTVTFQTGTRVCYLRPVAMTFVGGAEAPRILAASSGCFEGP
jgi:hypothetical protein